MAPRPHLRLVAPDSAGAWLSAEALGCERGERELFTALDVALAPGEILQVEGDNGTGKTSLLRILAGLLEPSAGQVRWKGADIRELREAYRAQLAYVGHKDGLKAELTPRENLAFAIALSGRAPKQTPDAVLEHMGLSAHADDPVAQLSAGQRRRVALARLLSIPATLWLLDEPFTALDQHSIVRVEEMLRTHVQAGGMAVVSTHRALQVPCRRVRLATGSP
ncbi:MAG: cytochrome c biogenesis heme-transporting ATPase CcmA [Gammaproteobacteria bacterium]|nr:cytochrome c biogenesis heme-transporting ATPase CcmA [Gammaproteobacteria bacterium]